MVKLINAQLLHGRKRMTQEIIPSTIPRFFKVVAQFQIKMCAYKMCMYKMYKYLQTYAFT